MGAGGRLSAAGARLLNGSDLSSRAATAEFPCGDSIRKAAALHLLGKSHSLGNALKNSQNVPHKEVTTLLI